MKKFLSTALIVTLLVLPLGTVALADHEEAPTETAQSVQEYIPGGVPAQVNAEQSMAPALHGVLLAMMNHNLTSFDPDNQAVAWESLYNMLSLYGQLDNRSEYQNSDTLLLLSETVRDYAAALNCSFDNLGPLPKDLSDRLTYDAASDSYQVVCGNNDQARFEIRQSVTRGDTVTLSGALVYLADGSDLGTFEATLQSRDNMFGYAITGFTMK